MHSAALLLTVFQAVTASCKASVGQRTFDFTPLGTSPFIFIDSENVSRYELVFCSEELCDDQDPPVRTASLCQHSLSFPDKFVLGKWDDTDVTWAPTDDGAAVVFKDGAYCDEIQAPRLTLLWFHCGDSPVTGFVSFHELNCTYHADFNLPAALCSITPSGGRPSLSGGSIFLIIFFAGATLFFTVGILYKRLKMGATNWKESIPCLDFWVLLPELVKDGFAFVFKNRCRRGGSFQKI